MIGWGTDLSGGVRRVACSNQRSTGARQGTEVPFFSAVGGFESTQEGPMSLLFEPKVWVQSRGLKCPSSQPCGQEWFYAEGSEEPPIRASDEVKWVETEGGGEANEKSILALCFIDAQVQCIVQREQTRQSRARVPCLLGKQMRARRAVRWAFIPESCLSISLAPIVPSARRVGGGFPRTLAVRLAPRWEQRQREGELRHSERRHRGEGAHAYVCARECWCTLIGFQLRSCTRRRLLLVATCPSARPISPAFGVSSNTPAPAHDRDAVSTRICAIYPASALHFPF